MVGIFFNALSAYGFLPIQITSIRCIFSALFMLVFLLIKDRSLFKTTLKEFSLFALSGAMLFLTSFFYNTSMKHASISLAVVLMYTAPALVMAVSIIFLGEKFTAQKIIMLVGILLGCALVSGLFGGVSFSAWGIISGILAGVSYGAYNIVTKIEMKRGNHPLTATTYCFISAGAIGLIFLNVPEYFGICMADGNALRLILLSIATGAFTSALPYLFYTIGMKGLPAGIASALGTVEPLVSCIVGIVLYSDPVNFQTILGIILMLGSCVALSRAE